MYTTLSKQMQCWKGLSILIHDWQYPKPLFFIGQWLIFYKQDATDGTIAKTDKHTLWWPSWKTPYANHMHVHKSSHIGTCRLKAHVAGTCPLHFTLGIWTSNLNSVVYKYVEFHHQYKYNLNHICHWVSWKPRKSRVRHLEKVSWDRKQKQARSCPFYGSLTQDKVTRRHACMHAYSHQQQQQ